MLISLAVLGILVAAPAAYGQAVDQYTPQSGVGGVASPVLDQAGVIASGGEGDAADGNAGTAGANAANEAGEGGGGKLPFTGYPLTPIVVLIALLLAAGVALRFAVPALDRRHG